MYVSESDVAFSSAKVIAFRCTKNHILSPLCEQNDAHWYCPVSALIHIRRQDKNKIPHAQHHQYISLFQIYHLQKTWFVPLHNHAILLFQYTVIPTILSFTYIIPPDETVSKIEGKSNEQEFRQDSHDPARASEAHRAVSVKAEYTATWRFLGPPPPTSTAHRFHGATTEHPAVPRTERELTRSPPVLRQKRPYAPRRVCLRIPV